MLGCSTVSIRAQGTVELTRSGQPTERVELVAFKNESLSGVAALCALTFIFYGGGCWAYLAYPTSGEQTEFENELMQTVKTAASCAQVSFVRASRNSWTAETPRLEMRDKKGRVFNESNLKELCRVGPRLRATPTVELPLEREKFSISASVNCNDEGCRSFTLSIQNKTDSPISIDWSRTQFVDHGQTRGVFMFEGVRYMDKNASQAPAIILPHGSYIQELFPSILVENPTSETGWVHQAFSHGQKGLALTLDVGGAQVFETVLFDLSSTDDEQPQPPSTSHRANKDS
jgi:hypothetical protein